jgi:nicotinamidase-related amidase
LEPLPREPIYHQSALSALASTEFERPPGQTPGEQIWVAGFTSAASLLATVLDGSSRGYHITVVEDALSVGVDSLTRTKVAEVLGKVTTPPIRWARTSQLLDLGMAIPLAANQP